MRRLGLLFLVFAFASPAILSARRAGYETDSGTISFLRYNLISGGEFTFPPEAAKQNLQGSGFFLMRLRPDGAVESVTMKMSTGHAILDQHIMRVLKAYRFRAGTKQPIEWLVGFIQPVTVIVKLNLIKEKSPAPPPMKK
jgi:TonB family protein